MLTYVPNTYYIYKWKYFRFSNVIASSRLWSIIMFRWHFVSKQVAKGGTKAQLTKRKRVYNGALKNSIKASDCHRWLTVLKCFRLCQLPAHGHISCAGILRSASVPLGRSKPLGWTVVPGSKDMVSRDSDGIVLSYHFWIVRCPQTKLLVEKPMGLSNGLEKKFWRVGRR